MFRVVNEHTCVCVRMHYMLGQVICACVSAAAAEHVAKIKLYAAVDIAAADVSVVGAHFTYVSAVGAMLCTAYVQVHT